MVSRYTTKIMRGNKKNGVFSDDFGLKSPVIISETISEEKKKCYHLECRPRQMCVCVFFFAAVHRPPRWWWHLFIGLKKIIFFSPNRIFFGGGGWVEADKNSAGEQPKKKRWCAPLVP